MAHSVIDVADGKVRIVKPGAHKFIPRVSEITFNGRRALAKGKTIRYVSTVGAFRLTEEGMLLETVMPGIDVKKDIIDACPMKIILPKGEVPVVSRDIVTGEDFQLAWH